MIETPDLLIRSAVRTVFLMRSDGVLPGHTHIRIPVRPSKLALLAQIEGHSGAKVASLV